ncbi:MAG: MMPL family transporter, partial [Pseudomonadota bacterium]
MTVGTGSDSPTDGDAQSASAAGAPERSFRFTFGLERLGLVALRVPYLTLALIVVASVLAAFGVMRLSVDDSLSELFRTNSPEFAKYEIVDTRFPSSEFDVLAVVEGEALLSRRGLTAVSNALIELQLGDGIAGVISMMSARAPLDDSGYAAPIVPDVLPEDDTAFRGIIARLRANEIVKGKFLSDDGRLGMIVLSLDRNRAREAGTDTLLAGVEDALRTALAGSGLTHKLTGVPVMQREIRNAVERDRIIYNGLGLLLGLIVAFAFF